MKISMKNVGPDSESSQSLTFSALQRQVPSSQQSLDPAGVLTIDIEGETGLQFDISGGIQSVPNSQTSNSVAIEATAGAKESGEGEGRITVKKAGKPLITVDVIIGGNTTVGLFLDSL